MAPTLQAVDTSGMGVTFEFRGDRIAEATRRADLFCANLGRNAALRSVAPGGDDVRIATFDCR